MDCDRERLVAIRNLHATILRWYDSADFKAKVLLTLDGALVGFVSSSVFAKAGEIVSEVRSPFVWLALGAMALLMSASIVAGLTCLWSRIRTPPEVEDSIRESTSNGTGIYAANLILYFGFIRRLDPKRYCRTITSLSPEREIEALSSQCTALSRNVFRKHVAVNVGFVCFGLALLALLIAATVHVGTVGSTPAA